MPQIKFNPSRLLKLDPVWVKGQLKRFLEEDAPDGDATTNGTVPADSIITAQIQAVDDFVFAGAEVIPHCFGDGCKIKLHTRDGDKVQRGHVIGTVKGPARTILAAERPMLNLIQRLSGIATMTKNYVMKLSGHGVKVLDTRKTTPGLRLFEKYAVAVGGGYNHRMDLSSAVLIKDNHLKATPNLAKAVQQIRELTPKLVVEVEVENRADLQEGLAAGVDAFLLDNMSPAEVTELVTIVRQSENGNDIFIEASGGIKLDTIADYGPTGIDAISVGALTHSVIASDIRLEFV